MTISERNKKFPFRDSQLRDNNSITLAPSGLAATLVQVYRNRSLPAFKLCLHFFVAAMIAMFSCEDSLCFNLISENAPLPSIVLPRNPSTEESFAAKELQDYLHRISGRTLEVVSESEMPHPRAIYLGNTMRASNLRNPSIRQRLESQAFWLKTDRADLIIYANSGLGVLYGTYELLEIIGVRWLVAGELGTVVPKALPVSFPDLDEMHRPQFTLRSVGGDLWSLRNKCNFIYRKDVPFEALKIKPRIFHTMDFWLPPERYFSKHPDYYGEVKGKRYAGPRFKLEVSDDRVARVVARNISNYLSKHPDTDMVALSPMDGTNFSETATAKAMDEEGSMPYATMSRRYFVFYSNVCTEVLKTHPNTQILVGAYHWYTSPPKDPLLPAPPNMSVIIAHYGWFDLASPITDPSSRSNTQFLEILEGWEELVGGRIYLYEYYWKLNWYDLPWPVFRSISKDIPWIHSKGYGGIHTQASPKCNGWTHGLNYYVAAKLLWDPNDDPDRLRQEWIRLLFKEASPAMDAYYAAMEEAFARFVDIPGRADQHATRVFSPVLIASMKSHLNKAESMATDTIVKNRLERVRASFTYTENLLECMRQAKHSPCRSCPRLAELLAAITENGHYKGVISPTIGKSGYYLSKYYNSLGCQRCDNHP